MTDFLQEAQTLASTLTEWRRDLHRHPELGFEEVRTSKIVARHLSSLEMEVTTGVGKTGVVGILEGNAPGPTVMLRFDMDALPIQEENDTEYASQTTGVMHACGHDGHAAIGMGVAAVLARHQHDMAGRVKFVFQPAEEGMGGARAMIEDGVLESPRPDVAFGLHLWNILEAGRVIVQSGPFMAAADRFELTVYGQGGHGAQPHMTVDALVVGAQIVTALQTVVNRNVDPAHTAVLTVGSFRSGDAFNIIPGRAEMTGGLRSFDEGTRQTLICRLETIVQQVAAAFDARAEVKWTLIAPAVVNDGAASAHMEAVAQDLLGAEQVGKSAPAMISEDMADFLNQVPGCFFFLGSMNEAKDLKYAHHNPCFDFDESALPLGVALLAEATARKLR